MVEVDRDDAGAGPGEQPRDGRADAGSGAGDDRDFPVQIEHPKPRHYFTLPGQSQNYTFTLALKYGLLCGTPRGNVG